MKYNPQMHRRRSIRLKGYDYSQAGAYFITICTPNRECLFGDIVDGKMRINDAVDIIADEWLETAEIRNEIELDEWVMMPNHFHGIVVIADGRGDRRIAPTGPQPRSIGAVMAGFKSAATKRINELHQTPGAKLWQRNDWEHIIRNESELGRIREYIRNNPAQWELDKLHPGRGDPPVAPTEIREPSAWYGHDVPCTNDAEGWMV